MPGMRCAVSTCGNSFKKIESSGVEELKEHISFHRFPKDPILRKIWVKKCSREDKWNPDTSYICSTHFESGYFEHNFKAEFLNIIPKRRLKPTAIPSLKLIKTEEGNKHCRKKIRLTKEEKDNDDFVHNNIKAEVETIIIESDGQLFSNSSTEMTAQFIEADYDRLLHSYNTLKSKYNQLRETNGNQQHIINTLAKKLKSAEDEIMELRDRLDQNA